MPVNYIDFKQAKDQQGLRMVVVGDIPSPWAEAAKGILHVKKIPWSAVYYNPRDNDIATWGGSRSAPVVVYDSDAPRSGWAEILLLAERLAPEPELLPKDPKERAFALGLCHEICGEMGLGWVRRLDSVHHSLSGHGGFPEPIAKYLGSKYGYQKQQSSEYSSRIVELLNMLAELLHVQRDAGERFYLGSTLSAVDIYSATFMAYFKPLPAEQCLMSESIRSAFESFNEQVEAALDPILIEHRDFIYSDYLELPLSL